MINYVVQYIRGKLLGFRFNFHSKKYYKDYIYTERLNEIWDTQYKNFEYNEKQEVMELK